VALYISTGIPRHAPEVTVFDPNNVVLDTRTVNGFTTALLVWRMCAT